jgi:hypothetical protein
MEDGLVPNSIALRPSCPTYCERYKAKPRGEARGLTGALRGWGARGTARRRQTNSIATIRFREKQAECEAFPPSTALAAHSAAPTPGQASIVGNEDGEMWVYGWPRPASAASASDMPITPRKAAVMLSVRQMK